MKLSIVTTTYQSSAHIAEFVAAMTKEAEKLTSEFELIIVDDGSTDNTVDILRPLLQNYPKTTIVELSRNFGHHRAIMTGLSLAKGEFVFLLDSDLEEDPKWLKLFWDRMAEPDQGDVIYGIQEKRKGNIFEQWTGAVFYSFFNFLSDIKVTPNLITTRLMTRRYLDALLRHHERELFLGGLWAATGFRQIPLPVLKKSKGNSSYSLSKKIDLAINSITSFSARPLHFIFYMGVILTTISALYILSILYRTYSTGIPVMGWPSLIASIWFIGGTTIFSIGVVGMYLSRVYYEAKQRPYSIIKQITRGPF